MIWSLCLSGGKDSYTLLDILSSLQRHAPINFELHAVNLDQKQPGFPSTYSRVSRKPWGDLQNTGTRHPTRLSPTKCPRGKPFADFVHLRRGILYNYAESIGANKIALGHHRDDIVETLFLNMFYGGKLKAMPPKLLSDDKRNIVIRPLAYCKEAEISRYAELAGFPIIPCDLCGSQDNLQRQAIKGMLRGWQREHPGRVDTIFRAICNVSPSQLADSELFDFSGLEGERSGKAANLNLIEVN